MKLAESKATKISKLMEFKKELRDVKKFGPTSSFWSSFIEMMDILFAFQRSLKHGDWQSHLQATEKMLPYFFAYDHQNYARYLTYYWVEMTALSKTHPKFIKNLCKSMSKYIFEKFYQFFTKIHLIPLSLTDFTITPYCFENPSSSTISNAGN